MNHLAPAKRDIAMVFQNYALYPHKTVAQNMAFALKLRRTDPAIVAERVGKAADILGLKPYLHRYPRQLSGGQRQRVAMGRAIVRDPQVFLFDEPLSNLDAKLRVQMRTEIKELHQRLKTTTVYVTHDQVEAMTMADKIVVMQDGRVEQVGAPLELFDRPANVFVAGFIGSPSMNLLKGTVVGGRRAARRRQLAGPRSAKSRTASRCSTASGPSISNCRRRGFPRRYRWSSRPAPRPWCSCASAKARWWRCFASGTISSRATCSRCAHAPNSSICSTRRPASGFSVAGTQLGGNTC